MPTGELPTYCTTNSAAEGKHSTFARGWIRTSRNPAPASRPCSSAGSARANGDLAAAAASGPACRSSAAASAANPGDSSIGPQTARASRPPGTRTRCISRRPAARPAKNFTPAGRELAEVAAKLGRFSIAGPRDLARALPGWGGVYGFATVRPAEAFARG